MNFFKKHFDTAISLIEQYSGSVPLSIYLKQYFAQHKKYGAKDRRQITHVCYCYYRLGCALKTIAIEERLRIALFLCNSEAGNWLLMYDEDWQAAFDNNIDKRLAYVETRYSFKPEDIFFQLSQVSAGIDKDVFAKAHLIQPDLFIRIRPHCHQQVINKLNAGEISYRLLNESCAALSNTTKIDSIIRLNKEAVVQDYSSQRIAGFLQLIDIHHKPLSVWDCCAASGGKAILATDILPDIQLTVSDIRASIIHNLRERFKQAGIQHYQSYIADLTVPQPSSSLQYDVVICDAPCTGSGTWARTPEQLYFMKEERIQYYAALQQKIITNTIEKVKKGGYFLYITCSVYKAENEAMVQFIQQKTAWQLITSCVLEGYAIKADTMFAALFKNA